MPIALMTAAAGLFRQPADKLVAGHRDNLHPLANDDLRAVTRGEFGSRTFHELGFCIDLLGNAKRIDNTSKMKATCVTGVGNRIGDGFGFQQRSLECANRTDVRLRRALAKKPWRGTPPFRFFCI